MNVEIVFSGLCSFLNVNGKNPTMTEPSVILVRTDHHQHNHGTAPAARTKSSGTSGHDLRAPKTKKTSGKSRPKPSPKPPVDRDTPAAVEHVAFIAFDEFETKMSADPAIPLETASTSAEIKFLRLDGYQIEIENDPPGTPIQPDMTYHDLVVKKDDYWPEAMNKWDESFVPKPNSGKKPSKDSVIAYLRLGNGKITAGKVCPFPWQFPKIKGGVHTGNFAEHVYYTDFPHSGEEVIVKLSDLATGELIRTLRFSALPGKDTISIFVGNNLIDDIGAAVQRAPSPAIERDGSHFKFLNRVAHPNVKGAATGGPTPKILDAPPGNESGSGGTGGACGPENGNGAPPPPP